MTAIFIALIRNVNSETGPSWSSARRIGRRMNILLAYFEWHQKQLRGKIIPCCRTAAHGILLVLIKYACNEKLVNLWAKKNTHTGDTNNNWTVKLLIRFHRQSNVGALTGCHRLRPSAHPSRWRDLMKLAKDIRCYPYCYFVGVRTTTRHDTRSLTYESGLWEVIEQRPVAIRRTWWWTHCNEQEWEGKNHVN